MCSNEETLDREGKMPSYYRRYVDDTLTIMPNKTSTNNFLVTLKEPVSIKVLCAPKYIFHI